MKFNLLISCLFIHSCIVHSQVITDEVVWAKKFSSNGLKDMLIETDNNNNILVSGIFLSCPQCYIGWEGDSLYFQGNYTKDIFLAKVDSNGVLIWDQLISGSGDEEILGLKVDNNNNIILYIENNEPFLYSGNNIKSGNNLLKLDGNGQLIWSENIIGAESDFLLEPVSITCNDEIIIGGSVQKKYDYDVIVDTLVWGSDTIFQYLQVYDTLRLSGQTFNVDTNNIFVAKFGAQGDFKWIKIFEHLGSLTLSALDASKHNEINILGFFQDEDWEIDGKVLPIDTTGYLYKRNIFVMKLNEFGEINWVNNYFDNVLPYALTTDKSGSIICSGRFLKRTYFGQDTVSSTASAMRTIIFKIDSTGKYLWATNEGDLNAITNYHLLTNNFNDIYFSGNINPHLGPIMYKYKSSGQLLWVLNPVQSANRDAGDIAFDYSGNLIQAGSFSGTFKIGNFILPYDLSGDWHHFLLKYKNQSEPGPNTFCNENTSITEENANIELRIYPNPTDGIINVSLHKTECSQIFMELLDLNGRLLVRKAIPPTLNTDYEFSIETFPSGVYLLKINSNNFTENRLIFLH